MVETLARTQDGKHWTCWQKQDDCVLLNLRGVEDSQTFRVGWPREQFTALLALLESAPAHRVGLPASHVELRGHATVTVCLQPDGSLQVLHHSYVRNMHRVASAHLPADLVAVTRERLIAFIPDAETLVTAR